MGGGSMTDWQNNPGGNSGTSGEQPTAGAPPPPPPPPAPTGWEFGPSGWTPTAPQPPQQPGQWSPQQPGQWPAGPYQAAPSGTDRRKVFLLLGVAAVVVIGLVGLALAIPNNELTATSSLAPDAGTVIYSDDFTSQTDRWSEGTLDDGSTFAYGKSGYVVTGRSSTDLWADPPHFYSRKQLSVSTTATLARSRPDTGFGVACYRGRTANMLTYEFFVLTSGEWYIQSREGDMEESTYPDFVDSGEGVTPAGSTPVTIVAICADIDDTTTRLVMFVDGEKVYDETKTRASLPPSYWTGALLVTAVEDGPEVTFTHFEERDLEK